MSDAPARKDEHDPQALSVAEALERIARTTRAVSAVERIDLSQAHGRTLACAVDAPFDVPPHTSAAMDGYALRAADLPASQAVELALVGESFAGRPYPATLGGGQCVRIMTGAVVPAGADAVVMQEHARRDGDRVTLQPGVRGGHVRHAGEDLTRGERVLDAGRCLNAADLGVLASLGCAEVEVRRRVVAAVLATGDELRALSEPLGLGEIHDSNRYTLGAMLARHGARVIDMGAIRDAPAAVSEALTRAASSADIVITSGGVSVGAADYIRGALGELGAIDFWRIAVKPGRPLAFGQLGDALFFGLPGNPVSVMVTFLLFVRPALQQLAGLAASPLPSVRARTASPLQKAPGRRDYQRGVLTRDGSGHLTVETTGLQGSHVLSSMSRANALIALPRESGDVEAGAEVEAIPLEGLL